MTSVFKVQNLPKKINPREQWQKPGVSVVLRRQVPIRFEETARSWFGGLPQMPEGIAWPRDAETGVPLHFMAQVNCADLPEQLWDGRGPRSGWLLLFLDTVYLLDRNDEPPVRVLHIEKLGPEREPPEDMPTVRHAMSEHTLSQVEIREGVPKLWRRWPVDIVVQPHKEFKSHEGKKFFGPPHTTGENLYGAPEHENVVLHISGGLTAPLTWRGALYFVEGYAYECERVDYFRKDFKSSDGIAEYPSNWRRGWVNRASKMCASNCVVAAKEVEEAEATLNGTAVRKPSWVYRVFKMFASKRVAAAKKIAQVEAIAKGTTVVDDHVPNWKKLKLANAKKYLLHTKQHFNNLQPYRGNKGEAILGAEFKQRADAFFAWTEGLHSELQTLRQQILVEDLDGAIPPERWAEIMEKLAPVSKFYWSANSSGLVRKQPFFNKSRIVETAAKEDILDLYCRDAASRALIPSHLIADLEAMARRVEGVAHRMGGLPSLVQGDLNLDGDDLIFQLGSDWPMGWMWGDVGEVSTFSEPAANKSNAFDKVYATMNCH